MPVKQFNVIKTSTALDLNLKYFRTQFQYIWWRVGRDSSIGIATYYGRDGSGIGSRWRQYFLSYSRPTMGPTQPPLRWVPRLPGVKRPGRGVNHPSSSGEVKEKVELYLYSFSGPSWQLIERTVYLVTWKWILQFLGPENKILQVSLTRPSFTSLYCGVTKLHGLNWIWTRVQNDLGG